MSCYPKGAVGCVEQRCVVCDQWFPTTSKIWLRYCDPCFKEKRIEDQMDDWQRELKTAIRW